MKMKNHSFIFLEKALVIEKTKNAWPYLSHKIQQGVKNEKRTKMLPMRCFLDTKKPKSIMLRA